MGASALREAVLTGLCEGGFTVSAADDGMEAAVKACETPPGAVLASALLPVLDGIRLCRFLKTHPSTRGVPVVLTIPDGNRNLRFRSELAGADMVVPYSHPVGALAAGLKKLASDGKSTAEGRPSDEVQVLHSLSEGLLNRLERLETVMGLAEGLGDSATVAELFRRIAVSVLVGLGFERVWGGSRQRDEPRFQMRIAMGAGISRKPIELRHRESSAALAADTGRQVFSSSLHASSGILEWSGTLDYLDTPITAGGEVLGLIRADRGVTGRPVSPWSAEGVKMLADLAGGSLLSLLSREQAAMCREETGELLEALRNAALTVNRDKTIVDAMGSTEALLDREPHQLVGEPFVSVVTLRGEDQRDLIASVLSGEPAPAEPVIADNAQGRELEVKLFPGRHDSRGVSLVKVILGDVSREHRLKRELQDRDHEEETISDISRELQAVSDIESVCETLLRHLRGLYPMECISILLAGSLGDGAVPETMVVKAESGYREEWSPVGRVLKMTPEGRGTVLRAVYSARPVNIRDTSQTPDYVANQEGTASELVVPMISQGRVVGALDLQSQVSSRYNADDVKRIQKLADQAAGAVESALMRDELLDMARRDRLTGLHNLRYFEEKYGEEFEKAVRYGYPFSLIMIDIDDFKVYNDTYGHPMGNILLKRLVAAMKSALREVDIAVRYGGEEFVCILPLTDIRVGEEVAERIRKRILDANPDIPHAETQPGGRLSVSLGVASFPADSRDRDELLELADRRMYNAKKAGKNRVCAR